jgi:hypothetical protein
MDDGEKLRSADVLQQFDNRVEGHETDPQRAPCAPLATCTPPQNPAVPGRSRGEADVEALAPWVRHVPHPSAGHLP